MPTQLTFTRHARIRSQQRAIHPRTSDLLWDFGSEMQHRGARVLFFDKAARRRLKDSLPPEEFRRMRRQDLAAYAVVGDAGQVVTVGYRVKRFRRP